MTRQGPISRRLTTLVASLALAATSLAIPIATAAADPVGVQQRPTGMVTAEQLPTAQINGVAWTQLIVGSTVFVGGTFSSARPAGSPAGSNQVARSNLMSYDLITGQMTSFAPILNSQVKTLAAHPTGAACTSEAKFTSVNGRARYRLAAFDVATGTLIDTFQGGADYIISSIVATQNAVYVGGAFSTGYSTRGGGGADALSRLFPYFGCPPQLGADCGQYGAVHGPRT